jgi:hypothetical protein
MSHHHASNESLPPREADGDETGAIGPLACIKGILSCVLISRVLFVSAERTLTPHQ